MTFHQEVSDGVVGIGGGKLFYNASSWCIIFIALGFYTTPQYTQNPLCILTNLAIYHLIVCPFSSRHSKGISL